MNMIQEKRITVFTPTYNRKYILSRLYKSLITQTNSSFLWLIVDDGSNDNTENLVNGWIKDNIIDIRYYKQENAGKQRAHNKGVELCDTELFICVDSDDFLIENAIEIFISTWDSIKNKDRISGIVALKGKSRDIPLGAWMPSNVQISTLSDLYNIYKLKSDTALLYRTDILKQFPFFVADGEKFMGEGYVYNQIDRYYSLYLLNNILCICEYLSDGYSANVRKVIKNNPKGYMILNKQKALLSKSIKNKYLNTIRFMIGCILSKEKHILKNSPYKVLAFFSYPPARLACFLYYRKC